MLLLLRAAAAPRLRGLLPPSRRLLARAASSAAAGAPDRSAAQLPGHLDAAQKEAYRHSHQPPGVERLRERYWRVPLERVRNFSIVAHVDHGKSTLSDKLLEAGQNIWPTERGRQQVLDTLLVERQRGITVKAQSASILWRHPGSGLDYLLNLVDTPGHVDFSYEVSRALASCQGALLLVDCAQGVQAQTVANHNAARDAALALVPVLTKIDLPSADPEPVLAAMQAVFGFQPEDVLWTSAKTGAGIDEVFAAIVERIPPPPGGEAARSAPLRALLVDAWHDTHRGVVCLVAVKEGALRPGEVLVSAHSAERFTVQEAGLLAPSKCPIEPLTGGGGGGGSSSAAGAASLSGALCAGQVGYLYTNIKSIRTARIGDTFFNAAAAAAAAAPASATPRLAPLPGFLPAKPMVYASLYPVDSGHFSALALAVSRLTLNDASVSTERESSSALGFGLRCGFLGLLHMDVFVQRMRQEFAAECIVTAPCVAYRVELAGSCKAARAAIEAGTVCPLPAVEGEEGEEGGAQGGRGRGGSGGEERGVVVSVERPGDFPSPQDILTIWEPTAHVTVMAPAAFLSPLLGVFLARRGVQEDVVFLGAAASGADAAAAAAEAAIAAAAAQAESALASAAAAREAAGEGADGQGAQAAGQEAGEEEEDEDEEEEEEEEEGEEGEGEEGGGGGGGGGPRGAHAPPPALTGERVVLKYRVPWSELVSGFYDDVKSLTAGYASVDWAHGEYAPVDAVKVDVLLNGKPVDALCFVTHRGAAVAEGRAVCKKLIGVIARQQFEVVVQAALGTKVFARERIAPYRKDVLIKSGKTVGGGDVSRKQKLLQKQREGKKRMKTVGNISLPQEAFHAIISKK